MKRLCFLFVAGAASLGYAAARETLPETGGAETLSVAAATETAIATGTDVVSAIGTAAVLPYGIGMPGSGDTVNRTDAKGRKQGFWEKTDRKLSYRGYFKDGMPTGWFEYTGKGDTLVAKAFYFRGGYASYNRFFYPDGNLMCEGYYLDKRKDSLWVFYTRDGRVIKEENYEQGLLNGAAYLYDAQGGISERQHWFRGLRNGPWYVHDENGYQHYSYKLNLTHGRYLAFYPDSTLFIDGNYQEGVKQGKWSFYLPGGSLYKEDTYKDNKLVDRVLYIKINGELRQFSMDTVRMVMSHPQGGKAELLTVSGKRWVCDDSFEGVCSIFDLDFFFFANKNTFLAFSQVDAEAFWKVLEEKGLDQQPEMYDGQMDSSRQLGETASSSGVRIPLRFEPPFPVYVDANGLSVLKNNLKNAEVEPE